MATRKLWGCVPALVAMLMAGPARGETVPPASDAVQFWRNFQLRGATSAAQPNDLTLYYIKQFWFTPDIGLFTFYSTSQSIVLRAMAKFPVGGEQTVVEFVPMAGFRFLAIGSSLLNFSNGFREGPEIALNINFPLSPQFVLGLAGSYAHLFTGNPGPAATPNSGENTQLVFYGANFTWKVVPETSLAFGLLGAIHRGYTTGTRFHDLGPTVTVSHKF